MKTVARYFKTLAQAEAFQDALYATYNSVRLFRSPLFSEDGRYIWHVA